GGRHSVEHRVLQRGVELVGALHTELGASRVGSLLGAALHRDVERVTLDAHHQGDVLAARSSRSAGLRRGVTAAGPPARRETESEGGSRRHTEKLAAVHMHSFWLALLLCMWLCR